MVLTTYIVRFYGFVKNRPHRLVGVVEEVGVKGRKAFTNYDELWDIFIASKSTIQKRKPPLVKARQEGKEVRRDWNGRVNRSLERNT
jgi:hypothetical protein